MVDPAPAWLSVGDACAELPSDAVEVGKVLDAWGIKGGFKVQPYAGDPQALFSTRRWYLLPPVSAVARPGSQRDACRLLKVGQVRAQGDWIVAQAPDIVDRTAAEGLRGARVYVPRGSFPTPGDDEHYWIDLIGLRVVNRDDVDLGSVVGLLDTGPHSVLRVQLADAGDGVPPSEERLIPFVAAYVDAVETAQRRIRVDWSLDYRLASSGGRTVRFDVITLFPELFAAHTQLGVTRRAFDSGAVALRLWPLRAFGDPPHQRVDDRPYGGGPGMVMLVEPLERALSAVHAELDAGGLPRTPLVLFTPTGRRLDQAMVRTIAATPGALLLCGRYEGIDQRFIDRHVDLELSLGDFVLSGGELPALALIDAVARLQDGVLGDPASHQQDSFSAHLLDCPHYSRPVVLGRSGAEAGGQVRPADTVPAALLSGHHAQIAAWRRVQSLRLTSARRPDLISAARAAGELSDVDERLLAAGPTADRGI